MKNLTFLLLLLFCFNSYSQKKTFKREFYFATNSSEIDSTEFLKMTKFLKLIGKFNLKKIEMYGCTDSDGSVKSNLILSKKRIETIQNIFLQNNYLSISKLKELGEENPKYKNDSVEKFKNRRVEVIAFYSNKKGTKKKNKNQKKHVPKVKPKVELTIKETDLVKGKTIDLPSVRFYGGTANFLPGAEQTLVEVVTILKKHPKTKIEIAGHICCGNQMQLSVDRAKKVYDFLIINGINKKTLTFVGYNNTQPKFGNIMDIRNRRVEMRVL